MTKAPAITIWLLLLVSGMHAQQKSFSIWPGTTGTFSNKIVWEALDTSDLPGDPLVYHVIHPTRTYFPADDSLANGRLWLFVRVAPFVTCM